MKNNKASSISGEEILGNVLESKATRESKRRRSVSLNSDVQLHQIKSTTLRTTANSFFGTHQNISPMSISDGAQTLREGNDSGGKSRAQLLQTLDPIVMAFNAADFETLAKSLRTICSKDVVLLCKLSPDLITEDEVQIVDIDTYIFPEPPIDTNDKFYHHLSGVSALLLLWVLLHETHPDAVMQIIDKRICYRQVVNLKSDHPCIEDSLLDKGSPRSRNRNSIQSVVTQAPVTIIEAVLKFSGSCLASRSLDDLFADLARHTGVLAPICPSTSSSNVAKVVGSAGMKMNPNALAEYISNYLTHGSFDEAETPHETGVAASKANLVGANKSDTHRFKLQQTSRKYLADVRLVLNELDLVTDFEFEICAAEDF